MADAWLMAAFDRAQAENPEFWLCKEPGCILALGHDDPQVTETPTKHAYTHVAIRNVPNDGP